MNEVLLKEWSSLTDYQLMNYSLKNLRLDLEIPFIKKGVCQAIRELRNKGLVFKPHFWISTEWFCPDGIPGIAVPFYLLHPRLKAIEKRLIGYVEGEKFEELMKILRHEIGHAIDNAYNLRSNKDRRKIFGFSDAPYPTSYLPRPYSRKFVKHLKDFYSQSHPDEDFAETFAVWLDPGSNWRKKYGEGTARKKLFFIDCLMSKLRGKKPENSFRGTYEPLNRIKTTLGAYYKTKRQHLKINIPSKIEMDDYLFSTFVLYQTSGKSVSKILKDQRTSIRNQVAEGVGEYKYRVDKVIRRLSKRAEELNLKSTPRHKLGPILDMVTAQTLDDLKRKRQHIIL